jgi:DNA-binding GntR family transcriptional regulator
MMGARRAVLIDARGCHYGSLELVAVMDIQQDVIAMLVPYVGPGEEVRLAIEVAAVRGVELIENQILYVPGGRQAIDLSSQPGESVEVRVTCHLCHSLQFGLVVRRLEPGAGSDGGIVYWMPMAELGLSGTAVEVAEWADGVAGVDEGGVSDRVSRFSLSDQIAERLRNDIVHGRIPAGTRLVQDELCDRFGTSRIPVRDALQQLTHEGILQQQGQQRVVVRLGAEDLREALALTAVLHGWAAGRAAGLASEAEMDELGRVCRAAVDAVDPFEFGRLGMQFHRQINLLAQSPRLIRTLIGIQQTVPRTIPFTIPEEVRPAKKRLEAILAAIRSRDARQAERLTRANMMIGLELLLRSWESTGGE